MPESLKSASQQTLSRYAIAFAAALLALALRSWLTPFLGDLNLYHTAWVAVAFSAWYCGVGPSIFNSLTSLFGIWLLFLSRDSSGLRLDQSQVSGMIAFVLGSSVIIALGESARREREKANRIEHSLRQSEARLLQLNQDMQRDIEQRTAELAQRTAQTVEQARFLDLANDAIFVRNANHRIAYWNQGAERLYGWSKEEAVGRLVHELLHTVFPVPLSEIAKTERWEGELQHFKRDDTRIIVASRWTTLRDAEGRFSGWLEINTDITARKRAEDAARTLSGRILSLQDDERRRIARELHDSLGQYLVSVKVNLDLLANTLRESQQNALLTECVSSVEQCLHETRTISHLLHPPLLDEAGFASAARWFVDGFAQRSALQVDLDLPPVVARLDRDVEIALFRALQEALTNVHRHSSGSAVQIVLRVDDQQVQLRVTDNGRGIPPARLRSLQEDGAAAGVGLAGMRQRMRELGGSLEIQPASPGTTITVTIPLQDSAKPSQEDIQEDANRSASAA